MSRVSRANICVALKENLKTVFKKNDHTKQTCKLNPCSCSRKTRPAASRELRVRSGMWGKNAHFLFSAVRINGCCHPTPTETQEPRITNRTERKPVLVRKKKEKDSAIGSTCSLELYCRFKQSILEHGGVMNPHPRMQSGHYYKTLLFYNIKNGF